MPNIVNGLGQVKVGVRTQASVGISYLLDTYSGAAAAYSLRKLNGSYTGSAIRVRRSNDNTTLDVGFDANGNLDTTSLLNFVGANNISLYSEELDNAYWTKKNTSVVSNQTIAPDGTTTADLVSETTVSDSHGISPNYVSTSFPAGTSWNISTYVKKGSGVNAPNTFGIGFQHGLNLDTTVLFSFITESAIVSYVGAGDSNVGSSMTSVGNGWYRCSVWGTAAVTHNKVACGSFRFNGNSNSLSPNAYTGKIDANIYIWGWQFLRALNDTSILTTKPYNKTTTLTAGNGFVSIWYDQSSTYDASQQASASQPQIVSNGSLITTNGKPTIKFDGSNDFLVTSNYPFTSTDKVYVAHVSSIETNNVTSQVIGHFKQFNMSVYFSGYRSNARSIMSVRDVTTSKTYDFGVYNINTQYLYEQQTDLLNVTSALRIKSYRNNVQETMSFDGTTNTSLPTFTQPLSIGADEIGTNFKLKGNIQEIVAYYNVDQSSNRTGISSNINSYYSIY